jgi:hypothetical protein
MTIEAAMLPMAQLLRIVLHNWLDSYEVGELSSCLKVAAC